MMVVACTISAWTSGQVQGMSQALKSLDSISCFKQAANLSHPFICCFDLQAVDHPYLVVHSATAPGQAAGAAAEAGRKAAEASRAEAQEVAEQVAASGKLPI